MKLSKTNDSHQNTESKSIHKTQKEFSQLSENLSNKQIINTLPLKKNSVQYSGETLRSCIEKGEYIPAVIEGLRIITNTWTQSTGKDKSLGLRHYSHLDSHITKVLTQDINKTKHLLETTIQSEQTIYTRLQCTYILSKIKNQLLTDNYKRSFSTYEMLYKILRPGDILLLNAKAKKSTFKKRLGPALIKAYQPHSDHRTHAILIGRKEKNTPFMIHSTIAKVFDGNGGVEEINFPTYIEQFFQADILVLQPPKENAHKSIAYAYKKLEKSEKYDFGAASSRAIHNSLDTSPLIHLLPKSMRQFGVDHPDRVNCVELIAEGLGIERIKDISFPGEFLDEDILQPVYMCALHQDHLEK